MTRPELSVDELLTTTRAVRKRLDLERPVPPELVRECIDIALQAPTGGNTQNWHFVVVDEESLRADLADLYREAWAHYRTAPGSVFDLFACEPEGARKDQLGRVCESADYLAEILHRVPVLMIPCIKGRPDRAPGGFALAVQAASYGSIIPATWSYMLAARARGLGTAWTMAHLMLERQAAELLGIPHEEITQVAMIPTAWYTGDRFSPALRKPLTEVLHTNGW